MSGRHSIDVLYFAGCPHYRQAVELVHLLVAELPFEADVRSVLVSDAAEASRLRFLGSPTVRVDGRDVEPGAEERTEYVLACRVYRTEGGPAGVPDPRWIVAALESASLAS